MKRSPLRSQVAFLMLLLRSTLSQMKQSHSFTNEVASKGIYIKHNDYFQLSGPLWTNGDVLYCAIGDKASNRVD